MKPKVLLLTGAVLAVPVLALVLHGAGARIAYHEVETGLLEDRLRPCPEGTDCVRGEPGDEGPEPFSLPGDDPELAFESLLRFLVLENDGRLFPAS